MRHNFVAIHFSLAPNRVVKQIGRRLSLCIACFFRGQLGDVSSSVMSTAHLKQARPAEKLSMVRQPVPVRLQELLTSMGHDSLTRVQELCPELGTIQPRPNAVGLHSPRIHDTRTHWQNSGPQPSAVVAPYQPTYIRRSIVTSPT